MKRASWIFALALMLPACGGESAAPPTVIPSPVGGASPSPSPSADPVPSPSPSPDASPTPDPVPSPTPHPSQPPPPPPPTPLPDLIIEIVGDAGGMSYSPSSANAKVGQTVIWKNSDSISHTATADGGAFDTGLIGPGAQKSVTMGSAGNFPYHCNVHPTMVATLNVTP